MPEWLPLRNRAQSMGISPGHFRKLFVVVVFYFIFFTSDFVCHLNLFYFDQGNGNKAPSSKLFYPRK